jgi:hypothetical protein
VDRVGGTQFRLEGTIASGDLSFGGPFDRAVTSRDGKYSVIYHALGTKALILHDKKLVREVNRSYYRATTYEYPMALFELPDGRPVIAHCPQAYNRIEIEELESGKTLTAREGELADFFHSRLQVSPDGEYLLSAGWVWHPCDVVQLFNIREVLQNPTVLDSYAHLELPEEFFEVHAATFLTEHFIVLVGDNGGEPGEEGQFLAQYDLREGRVKFKTPIQKTAGTIMAAGSEHILGFYEHPKLIEIKSGNVVHAWPELNSGNQNSSIIWHDNKPPPIAVDSKLMRFAVADAKGITVIQLG